MVGASQVGCEGASWYFKQDSDQARRDEGCENVVMWFDAFVIVVELHGVHLHTYATPSTNPASDIKVISFHFRHIEIFAPTAFTTSG